MKIIVFGATGGLGAAVVKQALNAGHQVKAFVRNPEKINYSHPQLEISKGDVLNQRDTLPAVSGQDVILSALGTGKAKKKTTVFSKGTYHIIKAAEESEIERAVFVSSAGVEDHPSFNLFYKVLRKTLLKNIYRDMFEMEKIIRASDLNWTIIQPYYLTDGEHTGTYRIEHDKQVENAKKISREDVGDLMVKEATSDQNMKKAITIAY